MATETWIKSAGTWREATQAWIKASGTWRQADEIWVKASGTWRKVYQAFVTISSATLTNDIDQAYCADVECNPGGASTSLSPVVADGDPSTRTYVWTKVSGTTPDSGFPNGSSISYSVPGQSLAAGQSVGKSGSFYVEVTDSTGNVTSNTASMTCSIQNDGPS